MKMITPIKNVLFIILALCSFQGFSQNLLTNGDFESGGSGVTAFLSIITRLSIRLQEPVIPDNTPERPIRLLMNSTYNAGGDHTTGTGNMLVIDGATATNQFFWTTGSTGGAINGFTAGLTYTFSYWIKSVSNAVTSNTATRANIGVFFVNAISINPPTLSNFAPLPADGWQRISYSFVATANNAMVRLQTLNVGTVGCDFAVDDFSITQGGLALTGSYTSVNPRCPTSNDGAITVTLAGGNFPYGPYSLTGTVTQTNNTGVFTGLPPGTYAVSATDFSGEPIVHPILF